MRPNIRLLQADKRIRLSVHISRADCTVQGVQRAGMQLNHIDLSLKKYFPRTEYSVEFGGHKFYLDRS